jgi:hypothetical protein
MSERIIQEQAAATSRISLPHLFVPRDYQQPLWDAFFEQGIRRACIVAHRRAGKDLNAWNIMIAKAMERVGVYVHFLPVLTQARRVIWDSVDSQGYRFLDYIPKELVADVNGTEMRIRLTNGSLIQLGGSDNYDRHVGQNICGMTFSEWPLANPAADSYMSPMLAENQGWKMYLYTPRGRNHGYELWLRVQNRDNWFKQLLTVDDTRRPNGDPVVTDEDIDELRATGMTEELIQQEFYCSFDSAMAGSYYGKEMKRAYETGRIGNVPIDPALVVHTAWDLGMDDATAIWFYQQIGREVRMVNYYEASGEGLTHYIQQLQQFKDENKIMYGRHYAPHDIEVRELSTGVKRKDFAAEKGLFFETCKRMKLLEGIDMTRRAFPYIWFDESNCRRGLDCLNNYRKEYDESRQTWSMQPVHDWSSHGADAFRTFGMAFNPGSSFDGISEARRAGAPKIPIANTDFPIFD